MGQSQFLHHGREKGNPLLKRIQQRHLQVRPGDGQRQAGKARAAPYVNHTRAMRKQPLQPQGCQRIQIMPVERHRKVRIAGQVHASVPLTQQPVIAGKARRCGGVRAQTIQAPRQFRLPRIQVYSFSPRYFTPQYFTHANASRI